MQYNADRIAILADQFKGQDIPEILREGNSNAAEFAEQCWLFCRERITQKTRNTDLFPQHDDLATIAWVRAMEGFNGYTGRGEVVNWLGRFAQI